MHSQSDIAPYKHLSFGLIFFDVRYSLKSQIKYKTINPIKQDNITNKSVF